MAKREGVHRPWLDQPRQGEGGAAREPEQQSEPARARERAAEADRPQPEPRERQSRAEDEGAQRRRGDDAMGGVLKRTIKEFRQDNLTDWAAALTYYGILSIFPALIALVSILGLIGSSATQPLIDNVGEVAPGPAKEIFTSAIENLQKDQGAAGVLFIVGLAVALWSASGYVAAFMRASNDIYDVEEGRPIWKTLPTRIGTTVVLLLILAIVAVAVVLTGDLAEKAGNVIGAGDQAVDVWQIAKWPILLLLVSFMFAFLYWAAPNVKHLKFRLLSPGGILAVVVWLIASLAFAFYVANFGSYNKTYGTLGGVVTFLVWLWITNIAVLLGAELNAEIERGRRIDRGQPPEREPFLEPRDTRKMEHPPPA